MKKIISLLLVLATVLSCFMLTVSADDMIVSDEGRLPFEDVKSNHWFYQSVGFCYANEIIKGMNEYTFGWNGNLTRAQFVLMLANLEGVDTSTYTVTQFPDVKSSHWYYGAVAWAYGEGIVSGMNDGSFAPNKPLSRAELAVIMKNYMDGKYELEVSDSVLDKFTDKPKSEYWYYEAMKFAVSAELLSGNSDGTLASTGTVTRAQAAVIFRSFMLKYFFGSCEHQFSEARCTEPAVCGKCGLVDDLPMGHFLTAYNCVTGGKCFICEEEVTPSKTLHDFAPATCTKPRTCTRCSETRGEVKGHNFKAATCTAPKTCTVCGAKEGAAKGHIWKSATCSTPKTCIVCNAVEGTALGHGSLNGACQYCGKISFTSGYDKVAYYIKNNGIFDQFSTYSLIHDHGNSITLLSYHTSIDMFTVNNVYYFDDGSYETVQIQIKRGYSVYEYSYVYFDGTKDTFVGYGKLDAATFTEKTKEGFSEYRGTYDKIYTENVNEALREMLTDSDNMLRGWSYGTLADLGFKVF